MNDGKWKIVATLDNDADGLVGVWHGGAYVDIYDGASWHMTADPVPFDVVNVYDYANGRPEIATAGDVVRILREYAARCGRCGDDRYKDCDGDWRCSACDDPCDRCADSGPTSQH